MKHVIQTSLTVFGILCTVLFLGACGEEKKVCSGNDCACDNVSGTCEHTCDGSNCRFSCNSSGACTFTCPGGSCNVSCNSSGSCLLDCPGNDCSMSCSSTDDCRIQSCDSGCDLRCDASANTCMNSCDEVSGCETSKGVSTGGISGW